MQCQTREFALAYAWQHMLSVEVWEKWQQPLLILSSHTLVTRCVTSAGHKATCSVFCWHAASMVECYLDIWNNGTLTLFDIQGPWGQSMYPLPSGKSDTVTVSDCAFVSTIGDGLHITVCSPSELCMIAAIQLAVRPHHSGSTQCVMLLGFCLPSGLHATDRARPGGWLRHCQRFSLCKLWKQLLAPAHLQHDNTAAALAEARAEHCSGTKPDCLGQQCR